MVKVNLGMLFRSWDALKVAPQHGLKLWLKTMRYSHGETIYHVPMKGITKFFALHHIIRYPIYHVPMKGITKNVSASFLTYHTLSSTFQDVAEEKPDGERKGEGGIRLSPFGLAAYKMQNDVWLNTHIQKDYENLCDLQNAAGSWLKQLSYSHHDFNFFTAHSNMEHGGYSL